MTEVPPALGHYQQYTVAQGRTVHIAGQVSVDATGTICGINNPATQATQVANNLTAVLAEIGLAPSAVVSVRVYAINEDAAGAWAEVRKALFPTNPPASTLVYVAGLAKPEFLLEVEAVASA